MVCRPEITLNIRSILQPLHSAALCDLIDSHHPDLFCLTETWIKPTTTFTELKHCTSPNYTFLSFHRTYSDISSSSSGGGTGFLIRYLHLLLTFLCLNHSMLHSNYLTKNYRSFDARMEEKIRKWNTMIHCLLTVDHRVPFSKFRYKFSSFLSFAATTPHEFIITRNFNIHLDNPTDTVTSQFLCVVFLQFNSTCWFPYSRQKSYCRILVSSSIVISLSLTKYHLCRSLCLVIIIFVNFVVSAPILTSKLPVPLLRTFIVHSKLDYCNSLYLPKSELNHLQVIQNSLARAVVKAAKFCHVTPIPKSLHWLKIIERIEYKLLSLTYKTLTTAQPTYL